MSLDRHRVLRMAIRDHAVTLRDTVAMTYALATGFGRDPGIDDELEFVYEGRGLKISPLQAVTLTPPTFLADCGWDYTKVLHAAQALEIHSPLLLRDEILIDSRVLELYDRENGAGSVLVTRSEARRQRDNRALFSSTSTWIARADKCGYPASKADRNLIERHALPQRDPDFFSSARIDDHQAALYRLCGDRNPLHIDPAAARAAGFEQPIVHGLCTLGIVCRAILNTVCGYDTTLIASMQARFSAPVFARDALRIELWQDGSTISFRVRAEDRGSVVVDNGRCELAG